MSKKAQKANPSSAALRQQAEEQVYQNLQQSQKPPAHLLRNCFNGFNLENVGAPTSAIMILLAVILTVFGVYDHISQLAGAGSAVPITGFANSVSSAALEYRSEGMVLGIITALYYSLGGGAL